MIFSAHIKDDCLVADYSEIKVAVRKTGLRSKSTRKIMKRWKLLVHRALNEYIDKELSK